MKKEGRKKIIIFYLDIDGLWKKKIVYFKKQKEEFLKNHPQAFVKRYCLINRYGVKKFFDSLQEAKTAKESSDDIIQPAAPPPYFKDLLGIYYRED